MAHHSVSRNNASVLSKIADKNLPILSNFIRHVTLRTILVSSENVVSLKHDCKLLSCYSLQNLSLCKLICQWYNEKCDVSRRQSDYPDNGHSLWSLGIDRHLPFSIGKVCAEILNFAIADLYSILHTNVLFLLKVILHTAI